MDRERDLERMLFFPLAVFVAGSSMAVMRTNSLPKWVWQSGALVASIALVTSTTWARSGFWAPMGGMNYVGFLLFAAWVLAVSIALWQRVGQGQDAQAMAADRPMAMTP